MKGPRRGDVVEVEWVDSQQVALGWAAPRDYLKAAARPQSYRTAGYWLGERRGQVVVVLSIDPANGHATSAMTIPRVAVKQVQVLGRAHPRVRKALR